MDCDARYAAGLAGSNVLPSKNFSTPRLSDAGPVTPMLFAASRQISTRLTLFTNALKSVLSGKMPQRLFSAGKPQIVRFVRERSVVSPELHVMRRTRDLAAVTVINLALQTR